MTGDDPKYWFKRRRYGYGWIPVRWQGWAVLTVYLIVIISSANELEKGEDTLLYVIMLALSTISLLVIARDRGPRPKWRWGKSPDDNPNEDW